MIDKPLQRGAEKAKNAINAGAGSAYKALKFLWLPSLFATLGLMAAWIWNPKATSEVFEDATVAVGRHLAPDGKMPEKKPGFFNRVMRGMAESLDPSVKLRIATNPEIPEAVGFLHEQGYVGVRIGQERASFWLCKQDKGEKYGYEFSATDKFNKTAQGIVCMPEDEDGLKRLHPLKSAEHLRSPELKKPEPKK